MEIKAPQPQRKLTAIKTSDRIPRVYAESACGCFGLSRSFGSNKNQISTICS